MTTYTTYTMPSISVVIPVYNAGQFVKRTINSVLSQSYKPSEIIVIDDGSTDNTASLVKACGDSIRYIYQSNRGESCARNTGIHNAQGTWIAFLDHDDEWLHHHLMNAVHIINSAHVIKWYGAAFNVFVHKTSEPLTIYKKRRYLERFIDNLYFDDYLSVSHKQAIFTTSTMVIHKSVFDTVGMFNESLKVGSDLDMWFRVGLHFPQIGYCHRIAAHAYKQSTPRHRSHFPLSLILQQLKEQETFAKRLSENARRRAQPWITARITQLIKSRIALGDRSAVERILNVYGTRLPSKWRGLAHFFLNFSWPFILLFSVRALTSRKHLAFRKYGLWRGALHNRSNEGASGGPSGKKEAQHQETR